MVCMKVNVLDEHGYEYALLGLSLNKKQPIDRMKDVAEKLSQKDGGHNKFLEAIMIWVDITAPRYWWQQFDTYRVGVSKQSESTMHTLLKGYLKNEDFCGGINELYLKFLNSLVDKREFDELKRSLPESYLQRRIVVLNYKSLRTIYHQRKNHPLFEWKLFLNELLEKIKYKGFITGEFRGIDDFLETMIDE